MKKILEAIVRIYDKFFGSKDKANYEEKLKELENIINEYKALKNEFCLQCGKYKNEHLGACKGCRWYDK